MQADKSIRTLAVSVETIKKHIAEQEESVVEESESTLNAILQGLHTGTQNYTANSVTPCYFSRTAVLSMYAGYFS